MRRGLFALSVLVLLGGCSLVTPALAVVGAVDATFNTIERVWSVTYRVARAVRRARHLKTRVCALGIAPDVKAQADLSLEAEALLNDVPPHRLRAKLCGRG